jgi:membrane-bound metal-dependent hydrolase YbcI (DUF457 family)
MPSPVGHTLAGLAAAFLTNSSARAPGLSPPVLAACVAVAVAPDLDLLFNGIHRTYTHSLGAAVVVGAVSWMVARAYRLPPGTTAAAITAAYASHPLLDWVSRDTRPPRGLTILWPFSSSYFISGVDWFGEISRRYWLPGEFIWGNVRAAGWETFVLLPIAIAAWILWSGRTLKPLDR